jgi:tripartite-type tricarboxylate transporter receptor subunit TctC
MQRLRRAILGTAFVIAAAGAGAQSNWPQGRTIRIVVPFPTGGQTDVAARVLAQALTQSLKVTVIVDNKAGAHGFIGAVEVARAPADGYTLLMASTGSIAINPKLHEKMPYDPNRDFAPISLLMTVPIAVVINPTVLPINTLPELVAHAKAHPGQVNYASAGNGGSSHLVAEYFKFRTGTFMTHIPYRGEGPATSDLVAGQVGVMFNTLTSSLPHVKSGKLRMIAVATRQRLPEYPDVPTVSEALKLPDFDASSWAALYAPAGTPPDIVKRIAAEVDAALKTAPVANRLKELGAVPVGGTPQFLSDYQLKEQAKWGAVIQKAKIKPD